MTEEPTTQQIELMNEAERLEHAAQEREANNKLRRNTWALLPRGCVATVTNGFRAIPEMHKAHIVDAIRHYDDEDPNDPYRLNDYGEIHYQGQNGFTVDVVWKIDTETKGKDTFRVLTVMLQSDVDRFFS